jgi:hypothetical protein
MSVIEKPHTGGLGPPRLSSPGGGGGDTERRRSTNNEVSRYETIIPNRELTSFFSRQNIYLSTLHF